MITNSKHHGKNRPVVGKRIWRSQNTAIFVEGPDMPLEREAQLRPGPYVLIAHDLLGVVKQELAAERVGVSQRCRNGYQEYDSPCIERFDPLHLEFPQRCSWCGPRSTGPRSSSSSLICSRADERSGCNSTSSLNWASAPRKSPCCLRTLPRA